MIAMRPTVQFLLLVLLCYGAYHHWSPNDGTVIELTPGLRERILAQGEELYGRPLTSAESEEAVASYLEEELLVREAYRRGLDRDDREVRAMLVDHARTELLRSAGYEAPEPTEAELRAYFEAHAERYRVPERIDLHQVHFPTNTAPLEPDDALVRLRAGAVFEKLGAAGPAADVKDVSRSDIARAYGARLASEVFALPDGEWHGPFHSEIGTHFFRVHDRRPPRDRTYQEVEDYLAEDFSSDDADRVVETELAPMRRRYRVVLEEDG